MSSRPAPRGTGKPTASRRSGAALRDDRHNRARGRGSRRRVARPGEPATRTAVEPGACGGTVARSTRRAGTGHATHDLAGHQGGFDGDPSRDGHPGGLAGVPRAADRRAAQPAGRALPAAGQVQRRAHLGPAARRRRTGRPDQRRRLRPDGRHRRLRPGARRQVRDLLRAAHPRGHARRAADDGLGAAAGAQQGQQDGRGPQDAGGRARPPAAADEMAAKLGVAARGVREACVGDATAVSLGQPQQEVVRDRQLQGRPRDRHPRGQEGRGPDRTGCRTAT